MDAFDHHRLQGQRSPCRLCGSGFDLADFIDYFGPFDYFAEHGIAYPVLALSPIEKAIVGRVDEELAVMLSGTLVRAMASVYLLFFNPLPASFLIGLLVDFAFHVLGEATALNHEPIDNAMEHRPFVESRVDIVQEIVH